MKDPLNDGYQPIVRETAPTKRAAKKTAKKAAAKTTPPPVEETPAEPATSEESA